MMPLVSICVPLYNSEKFIENCLISLFKQTYSNIEYVFVDDCSTDNSLSILKKCIEKFPNRTNIKIFNNETNRGVAYTRNKCLENAAGEYITMVDSDDYIDVDYIERLVDSALKNDADIVCSAIAFQSEKEVKIQRFREIKPDDDLLQLFFQEDIFSCWAKLYHKSIFASAYFCSPDENLRSFEDKWILLNALSVAKHAVVNNEVKYHYIYNQTSLSHEKFEEKHFSMMLTYWNEVDQFLKERNLTDKYAELVALRKTDDKILIMLQPLDINVKKKYADTYRHEQYLSRNKLKGTGFKIMNFLIYHHLFLLVRIYDSLNQIIAKYKRGRF